MSVLTPPEARPATGTSHRALGPQPPRAEISSVRGVVIGLLIVLPFWLALVLSLIRG